MSAVPTVEVEPILVAAGANFRVSPDNFGRRQPASATPLPGGGFVATWANNPMNGNSDTERVFAQIYGPDGIALGAEFPVAPDLDSWQSSPSVVTLAGGGFVI